MRTSFWRRSAAFVVDILPITALVFALFNLFLGFDEIFWAYLESGRQNTELRIEFLFWRNLIRNLSALVWIVYCTAMETSRFQASIGKILFKLTIVDGDGEALSLRRAAARNITKLVSFLPLFLGCIWALWDKKGQAWHDKIAKTLVIVKPPSLGIGVPQGWSPDSAPRLN